MSQKAGCLGFLFGAGSRPTAPAMPNIKVNPRFISDAERSFFGVLRHVVEPRGYVLAQVALNRLLSIPGSNKSNPGKGSWHNRIAQKSVDFVVSDASTLRPLVAIELDDSSHGRSARQARDQLLDQICAAAGLPLEHVPYSRTYDTRMIADLVRPYLEGSPPARARG